MAKTLKQFLETVNAPRSEAERAFIKKHVVQVTDRTQPKDLEIPEKDKSRKADYQDGEDALVYEDINELVNDALCEGINLKVGVKRFDDGSEKVITRSDITAIQKVYASASDKLGVEKAIKKSKLDFEQLTALGE